MLAFFRPAKGRGGTVADGDLRVQPHYRAQSPLDPVLRKVNPALDVYVSERHAERIETIFGEWSAEVLRSPVNAHAIRKWFTPDFRGASMLPAQLRTLRSGRVFSTYRVAFAENGSIGRDAFVADLTGALSAFSKLLTAEFQITKIDVAAARVRTEIRYELVGEGVDFHREQRVGIWKLEWEAASPTELRVRFWATESEMRCRSHARVHADVTERAFAGSASYSDQLVPGVDHWRTVLDGACAIDIYGHNGVSVGDFDGDGFDDLYVCQPAGLPNRLFRNRGDGTFEDVTEGSGVGILDNTACAIFADFDNDGRQDLVVVRASGPLLFLNEGAGKFRPAPNAFHFANPPQGTFTGAAAADYDRDGWLDIYFCLYVYYQGTDLYKYPTPYYDAENGPPNFLMRNNRDGSFRDVTAASRLDSNNTRFSFCCAWGDSNGDGWPDLYVANDFGRKNLYRNNGDGTFTDEAAALGVEDVGAGMSVCWFDPSNKGVDDLYVANMWTAAGERISAQAMFQRSASTQVRNLYAKHAMGNSLFRNDGKGGFQDATLSSGTGMGRWSWSSDSWDFDHDGFADLYVVNGMLSGPVREDLNSFFWRQVVAHSPEKAQSSFDYEQGWNAINELIRADYTWSGFERNVFYANNGDGTFTDISGAVDLDFPEDGRAFALADFDRDGRQELFLKNRSGPQLRLLKNVVADLSPAIAFRLRGVKSNRDSIGAAVTIEAGARKQTRRIQAGSGFLSQHSKEVFFGLGDAKGAVSATIRWPSGLVQQITALPPGHIVHVEEGLEPSYIEPFRKSGGSGGDTGSRAPMPLPTAVETWLLAPIAAPDFLLPGAGAGRLSDLRGTLLLLSFCSAGSPPLEFKGGQVVTINVDEKAMEDTVAVYNILFQYLFDRHRNLEIPTAFLIDTSGEIVKVYQGPLKAGSVERDARAIPTSPAERLKRALPFAGVSTTYEFGRNHLSYGSVYFQRGYLEQAEASFARALRDDATSAEALYGMGSVYLKQEKAAEARASFEAAIKQTSSYPDTRPNAWNNLGLLATREGNIDRAIECFQEALRASPDHFVALENLGNAFRQSKRWEEARTALERAVAMRPEDSEANYSLGMVFAQIDDKEHALEYLQRALKANPVYPEALNNLGILYLRTRRRDDAVALFEECIRAAPAFDQAYLNLARVYGVEGDTTKAKAVLGELLKRHPDHAVALRALEQLR